MNDIVEKTASSLAVVEKKHQAPGGCVGIFFHLFDWNRRLAKKKLFSKKLLPPVRFKQTSKKLAGNEKQPKLRLIADENRGGFPRNRVGSAIVDIEQKHETRVPGLVARLMGLESMPALHRGNSKKFPAFSFASGGKAERFVDNVCRNLKEDLNVEKGEVRLELRPQKLQKRGVCEMDQLNRLGPEKLPFKNVLAKSRKHHPRLPSLVKTPRNHSRKSSSKLIGAATRILEPCLRPSKLKCAITYSNNSCHSHCNPLVEERWLSSPLRDSDGSSCVAAKEQPSCRNYGQLGNSLDSTPYVCKQPFIFASSLSHYVAPICQGAEIREHRQSAIYQDIEEELHQEYSTVPSPFKDHMHPCVGLVPQKNPFYGQVQQYSDSRQCKHLIGGVPVFLNSTDRTRYPNRMSRARSRAPSRKVLNNLASSRGSTSTAMNGVSTFLSANERLSCSTALRVPSRVDNDQFELERRIAGRAQTSLPPGRKRRPANNICRQSEGACFMGSGLDKQSIRFPQAAPGKQLGHNALLINNQCSGGSSVHRQENVIDSNRVNKDVLSFTNNFTVTEVATLHEHAERRVQNDLHTGDNSEESGRRKKFVEPNPLSGDELGALLEQKLKELTCQGEENSGNAPKKTTATILQELISALTSEAPSLQNGLLVMPKSWENQNPISRSISSSSSQVNAITEKQSVDLQLDSEHPSPGSVLEPYFSTESCLSGSVDDSLGYNTITETVYDASRSPKADSELLDSAASKDKSSKESVVDILKNVSESLCCSNNASFGLNQDKHEYAKKVLLNAELVFHNAFLSKSSLVGRGSPIKHLLLDELEMLAGILWMKFGPTLGTDNGKEVDELKRFAFDAIIEYLNSRFGGHTADGSTLAARLPIRMSTDALIFEVVEAVGRWKESSRFSLDELIDLEMSHPLGEWTQYETETYEEGLDMSRRLLQSLMDEIVMDFCDR